MSEHRVEHRVMRWLPLLAVFELACASSRVCPSNTRLATQDRPTGRVEWCTSTTTTLTALPDPARTSPGAHVRPVAMDRGASGPFTRWYPNGALESHGVYVDDGTESVPDGVWVFWNPDGTRKSVGRYDRGRPVGCFAVRDAQGHEVTAVVEGDQLREQACESPVDDSIAQIEQRARRATSSWGDLSLHTIAQTGGFGASNPTQRNPDPSARFAVRGSLRKSIGRVRVGPALGLRFSDSDDVHAYTGGVVAAFALPSPHPRLEPELEGQLGIQRLEIEARRPELLGVGRLAIWAPLAGVRANLAFALTRSLSLVGGAAFEGSPGRDSKHLVRYCTPVCGVSAMETWNTGGFAYGFDVGLRLQLR